MEQNTLVLGTSGSGKSLTLKQWAIQDIYDNKGLIFFDFDGEEVGHYYYGLRLPNKKN